MWVLGWRFVEYMGMGMIYVETCIYDNGGQVRFG